jgi:hypothetical protein
MAGIPVAVGRRAARAVVRAVHGRE